MTPKRSGQRTQFTPRNKRTILPGCSPGGSPVSDSSTSSSPSSSSSVPLSPSLLTLLPVSPTLAAILCSALSCTRPGGGVQRLRGPPSQHQPYATRRTPSLSPHVSPQCHQVCPPGSTSAPPGRTEQQVNKQRHKHKHPQMPHMAMCTKPTGHVVLHSTPTE